MKDCCELFSEYTLQKVKEEAQIYSSGLLQRGLLIVGGLQLLFGVISLATSLVRRASYILELQLKVIAHLFEATLLVLRVVDLLLECDVRVAAVLQLGF